MISLSQIFMSAGLTGMLGGCVHPNYSLGNEGVVSERSVENVLPATVLDHPPVQSAGAFGTVTDVLAKHKLLLGFALVTPGKRKKNHEEALNVQKGHRMLLSMCQGKTTLEDAGKVIGKTLANGHPVLRQAGLAVLSDLVNDRFLVGGKLFREHVHNFRMQVYYHLSGPLTQILSDPNANTKILKEAISIACSGDFLNGCVRDVAPLAKRPYPADVRLQVAKSLVKYLETFDWFLRYEILNSVFLELIKDPVAEIRKFAYQGLWMMMHTYNLGNEDVKTALEKSQPQDAEYASKEWVQAQKFAQLRCSQNIYLPEDLRIFCMRAVAENAFSLFYTGLDGWPWNMFYKEYLQDFLSRQEHYPKVAEEARKILEQQDVV